MTLAVAVRLPLCTRSWALPVLAALYLAPPHGQPQATDASEPAAPEAKKKGGKKKGSKTGGGKKQRLLPELRKRDESGVLPPRHKTPALLARQMIAALMHWFPDRQFVLLGDWGFASHDLPSLRPERIVELFAGRWSIEVTFEEARAHLGFETTRHWCKTSVLRVAPCLLGLFTVVSLIYAQLAGQGKVKVHATPCYRKTDPTFANALAAVRRLMWEQVILPHTPGGECLDHLPPALREMLPDGVKCRRRGDVVPRKLRWDQRLQRAPTGPQFGACVTCGLRKSRGYRSLRKALGVPLRGVVVTLSHEKCELSVVTGHWSVVHSVPRARPEQGSRDRPETISGSGFPVPRGVLFWDVGGEVCRLNGPPAY